MNEKSFNFMIISENADLYKCFNSLLSNKAIFILKNFNED